SAWLDPEIHGGVSRTLAPPPAHAPLERRPTQPPSIGSDDRPLSRSRPRPARDHGALGNRRARPPLPPDSGSDHWRRTRFAKPARSRRRTDARAARGDSPKSTRRRAPAESRQSTSIRRATE